jgi:Ca-activated chloride channel family protein
VLLSDGANNYGRDPSDAAAQAAQAHVPIHAISFGTAAGRVDVGGRMVRVPNEPQTLHVVVDRTHGGYHEAASNAELRAVYEDIGTSIGYRTTRQDIASWFIGVGLLLATAAALGSMRWFSRLP